MNIQPRLDGEFIEIISADTVFELTPISAPSAGRAAADPYPLHHRMSQVPPSVSAPVVDHRIDARLDLRIDGRIDGRVPAEGFTPPHPSQPMDQQ